MARRIDPYRGYANLAVQRALVYRARCFLHVGGTLMEVTVLYFLWRAVYQHQAVPYYSWEEMRGYLLIVFAAGGVVSFESEKAMASSIREGTIAAELTKPIDYQAARFSETAGAAVVEVVAITIAILTVGLVLFHISAPPLQLLPVLCASLAAAFTLKFLLSYLTGLLCFWTTNATGLILMRGTLTNLLSGALIPLVFMPNWLHGILLALPFQGVVYTPASIYLGTFSLPQALGALAVQIGWIIVLWWFARRIFRSGRVALATHGG